MKEPGLQVVIVGGGIGGLAFANCLQHAGINYVLIEKGKDIAPQIGAAVGFQPNASRIMDQIGCYDDIYNTTVGLETVTSLTEDGKLVGPVTNSMRLLRQRTGYAPLIIERQLLLQILAEHIKDKHRIRLSTVVQSIEQYPDKALVTCTDGSTLEADVVVGADGVHSVVRQEMWRHADLNGDVARFINDKTAMSAEYKCLFGISDPCEGVTPGDSYRTYAKDVSTLSYIGREGKVYWFVFVKMDQVYYPPDIPKFTQQDVEDTIKETGSLPIREGGCLTVADLYRTKSVCNLVSIEEASFQHWSYGRLVCLGDAIHKMTPHLGAGAASAIESAVVLTNQLMAASSKRSKPSVTDLQEKFQRYHDQRLIRVERAMKTTNGLTRHQALQSKTALLWLHYIVPLADDVAADIVSDWAIGAPLLDFLPAPTRSLKGYMPFNLKQGWGFEEHIRNRIWRALPLLALALISAGLVFQSFDKLLQNFPQAIFSHSSTMVTSGTNQITRKVALATSADAAYGLWLLESARLNNKLTLLQIPFVFCLAWQAFGQSFALPLYLFLFYIFTPIGKFKSADQRVTDVSYTCSTGPLILLLGVVPKFLLYSTEILGNGDDSLISRMIIPAQPLLLFPLVAAQFLIGRFIRPSTAHDDRVWAVRRDIPWIRWNTAILAILTSLAWFVHLYGALNLLKQVSLSSNSVYEALSILLGMDGTIFSLAIGIWTLLVGHDFRDAGMIDAGWAQLSLSCILTMICLGPGACFVLAWQWREETLISRRHRDAVIDKKLK